MIMLMLRLIALFFQMILCVIYAIIKAQFEEE